MIFVFDLFFSHNQNAMNSSQTYSNSMVMKDLLLRVCHRTARWKAFFACA